MNLIILMGRLTADVQVKTSQSGISLANFTLAVDRLANGEKKADFLRCVAFKNIAENIGKYFKKGDAILIQGSVQTRNYNDFSGNQRIITEVIVDRFYFTPNKKSISELPQNQPSANIFISDANNIFESSKNTDSLHSITSSKFSHSETNTQNNFEHLTNHTTGKTKTNDAINSYNSPIDFTSKNTSLNQTSSKTNSNTFADLITYKDINKPKVYDDSNNHIISEKEISPTQNSIDLKDEKSILSPLKANFNNKSSIYDNSNHKNNSGISQNFPPDYSEDIENLNGKGFTTLAQAIKKNSAKGFLANIPPHIIPSETRANHTPQYSMKNGFEIIEDSEGDLPF